MKLKNKDKIRWRKLDNTATVFPVISNRKFGNVFRVAFTLKEEIDKDTLQLALEKTLPWYKALQVKLKKGLFWYYFDSNNKIPIVKEENTFPCEYINLSANNDFLFRISYYRKRINFEVFHSVTDGFGALNFIRALTYNYIRLKHKNKFKKSELMKPYTTNTFNTEDSYFKHYNKHSRAKHSIKKAYEIKDTRLPLYAVGIIQGHVDLEKLLEICRQENVTISQYLTTLLIWCIYNEYYSKSLSKRDIKVYVPVDLRRFFNSTTNTNFFSFISVDVNFKKNAYSFNELLLFVKEQFENKVTKENLTKEISSNVATEKNLFVKLIPLFIKKIGIKIGYNLVAKNYHTATISNMGKIEILKEFDDYIENVSFLIGPTSSEPIKCSISSCNNDLVISFASILKDRKIERAFFRHLASLGINTKIESNGVYNENM